MAISKFDRRGDDTLSGQMKRIKGMKDAELTRRRIGWVIFFVVIIALFVWLWQYFGAGPVE